MAQQYTQTSPSPLSPAISATNDYTAPRPSFSRIQSTSSRRRGSYASSLPTRSYKKRLYNSAEFAYRKVKSTWRAMSTLQRTLAVIALTLINALGLLFLIYSHRILNWLGPALETWREVPGGWLILWSAIFFSAFPPLIGYSTALTLSGLIYGVPKGWLIAASGNLLGSVAAFIACRTVLSKYVHRLVGDDKRFHAFALTLKHDGLKVLIMIRLCPLPYSLSNGALSTFPTLQPLTFAVATLCATPKLFIHVFIGSRLASLAEHGGKMDTITTIVNYASIIGGGILGAVVGYVIYQRTVQRARELEAEENQALTHTPGERSDNLDGFFDDEEEADVIDATGHMDDDDISLWDHNGVEGYRDDTTDGYGVNGKTRPLDEEAAVGSKSNGIAL